ncbi:type II toxin-antitoxin system VapC family toxin [Sphingobium sp. Cam5-1]|uniref:type II toxin-antitoxin system VapC family toxin n=1 Tax=Sphingobium sp. Cam5-1 TaxID=2789327 RepID=UPI0018AD2111|nr:type II toxin-antitoxin system VapC family toxin [Sphingobium sp. Cam5-1]QPI75546.1 type II toxin-antitoxin system VapC family toxin [Sphingobium sp. Cam5-1]
MTAFVIDASVAVKWVITEEDSQQASSLFSGSILSAPDLIIAECGNILWKKVRRAQLTEDEALMAARILQHMDVELHPMRPLMERATRLAMDIGHPAYDCLYLALALEKGIQFVTADLGFVSKVRQTLPEAASTVQSLADVAARGLH